MSPPIFGTVPRAWPGSTVVCLASGPSLTRADVEACRGRARVMAINTTILLAPWADAFYACDARIYRWHQAAIDRFPGLKFSLDPTATRHGATVLRNGGVWGLAADPGVLQTGRNSGYQAINLAVHLGAVRIVLLGYDMDPGPDGAEHWHGPHPNAPTVIGNKYKLFRSAFTTLRTPLEAAGVTVINATRRTALETFPQAPLETVLDGLDIEPSGLLESVS